ncbi:EVE domain-containing protein [Erythrobacteraceae bacterium CFH 75059]|uniref:EVE domain-containing protein n=1 Tax=Qipengyuania thermophila TaxID=2509361 RepID=UPI0010208FA3|nr:EVE domain-containing protein [Qipengyuania thermophila]TCD05035.1 EVE domain-containing protein [Erythrobacteraceae bacterium CFH 75059]
MQRRWLMKSEPDVFGWPDLLAKGEEIWDGVRNHRARLNLEAMQVGDEAFFYHSNIGREIVGIVTITAAGLCDPTDPTGRWRAVQVAPLRPLKRPVRLATIKGDAALADMELVRQSRLSVSAVRPEEWQRVLELAEE